MTLVSHDSIIRQFPSSISSYRPSVYKYSILILITKILSRNATKTPTKIPTTYLTTCYYHGTCLFCLLNPAIILRIVHRWIGNEQPLVSISLRQCAKIMDRGRATMTTPTMTLELRIRIKQLFDTGFPLVNRGHGHSRQESRRLDNVID